MAKKLINGILTDDLTGDSGTVAVASIPALAPASGALSSAVAALVPASGLASSPVAVVGPVSDPKLCPRGIDFTLPGSPGVTVDVVEDGSGNLDFTVTVDNASGRNADLSGLFFQFNDQKLATLAVSGDPQITQFVTGDDSVINLKNGVNMNGAGVTAFDVGIEFGKAGIGSDHQNIQTTSFVLSNSAHDLTTDDFHQAGETSTVGVRTLSVGQKLVGDAPFAPTANPDSVTTLEDVPITIPISALATDPNPGATLAIHEIGMGPQFGTVTIAPDGQSLTYTPTNLDYMVNGVLTGNQDSFQYCVEDSLGGMDSNTITVADTPVADPPTVSVQVLAPEAGDPATLTRLLVTATSGDFGTAAAGSDFIKNLGLNLSGDVISGVALSDTDGLLNPITGTITTIGQSGLFTDEIDITAPSNQSINDNLTITANNDETEGFGSPVEASASTSQPIVIDFSQDSQTQDFQAVNQSIWTTGTAFTTDFNRFLGINTSIGGPVSFGIGARQCQRFRYGQS